MLPVDQLRRRARFPFTLLAYTHTRFPPECMPPLAGALRSWLVTWGGVGRIVEAMGRTGSTSRLTL